eukprot:TRINITY_DN3072_c0_g1_i1.p1 TRINITY_DN3072_c0_g1~~TRINITY_DN3072_c0_g1_i1.p1  ORF type:complete len:330 (-),score=58.62 TRINITY_DN3072_c0_g1_i1:63-1052(-)
MGNTQGYVRPNEGNNELVVDLEEPNQVQERNENNDNLGFNPNRLYHGVTHLLPSFFGADNGEELFGFNSNELQNEPQESESLPSRVSNAVTVKSPFNLNKQTLKLNKKTDTSYEIQFVVDSTVPYLVKIFYNIEESEVSSTPKEGVQSNKGIGQVFVTSDEQTLNLGDFSEDTLQYVGGTKFPVVITLQHVDNSIDDKVSSQITYATLYKSGNENEWEIKPLKQKLVYDDVPYVVYDIFGLDHNSTSPPEECVICMTEIRDTVVIPCRHLCVCHQCAQVLHYQSSKCPICRGVVRGMLKIKITKKQETTSKGDILTDDDDNIIDLDKQV